MRPGRLRPFGDSSLSSLPSQNWALCCRQAASSGHLHVCAHRQQPWSLLPACSRLCLSPTHWPTRGSQTTFSFSVCPQQRLRSWQCSPGAALWALPHAHLSCILPGTKTFKESSRANNSLNTMLQLYLSIHVCVCVGFGISPLWLSLFPGNLQSWRLIVPLAYFLRKISLVQPSGITSFIFTTK